MTHLMQPRYKVIADYPGCNVEIGSVFLSDIGDYFDRFPANFRKLQWWEDRQPEEMPEYVKRGNKVFKTDLTFKTTYRVGLMYLDGRDESGRKNFIWLHSCLPATLEEYNNYQTRPGEVK